jgi:hypothetical protein
MQLFLGLHNGHFQPLFFFHQAIDFGLAVFHFLLLLQVGNFANGSLIGQRFNAIQISWFTRRSSRALASWAWVWVSWRSSCLDFQRSDAQARVNFFGGGAQRCR